ncbi:MAG: hypothetical protein CBB66_00500 [bacterium TMED6]|nr:MAG: hypothetical protein CBB66_00500 [bacterium TMED6]|tara:strand:+ start:661 stop:1110 length:450 start_codon:yes stop_codon:yes gene_type:complete
MNKIKNYLFFLFLILIIGCNQYLPNHTKMKKTEKINHINDFKWINRVLVLKSESFLIEQIKINEKKISKRDIIIVTIDENTYIKKNVLSDNFYKSLKKKLKSIDSTYEAILIGLDGKIKKIYNKDIDLNTIFSDIDKMPMRINEMKKNN